MFFIQSMTWSNDSQMRKKRKWWWWFLLSQMMTINIYKSDYLDAWDQLKRQGKGRVTWVRPSFCLEAGEPSGQTNFTRNHTIRYFILKKTQCLFCPATMCAGLIKMVIFTIWYSSHCNILHLLNWVSCKSDNNAWPSRTHFNSTQQQKIDQTENKTRERKMFVWQSNRLGNQNCNTLKQT